MLLKNKTAVITGCNRGIGKAILESFSDNGSEIFACVRKISPEFLNYCKLLEDRNKKEIIPLEFDLLDKDEIKKATNLINNSKKNIDILVNNAGSINTSIFQMTSETNIKNIFETNFFSQITFTQPILKLMLKKNSGSIIFISSTSALDADAGRGAYVAAKSSINSIAKVLSKEVGDKNIRVNVIAPGLIDTDMLKNNTKELIIKNKLVNTSLKRLGETNEIANVALFLSSDLSSYITGQTIRVDGGMY
jgi:3-oxoacyl-[acyl-carrier protein] reductase